jgi:hypothetical protein
MSPFKALHPGLLPDICLSSFDDLDLFGLESPQKWDDKADQVENQAPPDPHHILVPFPHNAPHVDNGSDDETDVVQLIVLGVKSVGDLPH